MPRQQYPRPEEIPAAGLLPSTHPAVRFAPRMAWKEAQPLILRGRIFTNISWSAAYLFGFQGAIFLYKLGTLELFRSMDPYLSTQLWREVTPLELSRASGIQELPRRVKRLSPEDMERLCRRLDLEQKKELREARRLAWHAKRAQKLAQAQPLQPD